MKLEITDEAFTKFLNKFIKGMGYDEGHIDVYVTEKEEVRKISEVWDPHYWWSERKINKGKEKDYKWKRLKDSIKREGIKENPIVYKITSEVIKGTIVEERVKYVLLNGKHRITLAREVWGDNYNITLTVIGEFRGPESIIKLYKEDKDIRWMIDELGHHIIGRSLSETFSPNDNDTVRTTV